MTKKNATIVVKVDSIKANPNNPRLIKDDKFKKLVKSIEDFPQMLELRPVVVNKDMIILGGNMRWRAAKESGIKEIPVYIADNLTAEQEKEFVIKDNIGYGEWDWDILANDWDIELLDDWGLQIKDIDILGDEESSKSNEPKATDDNYSIFELVMLHDNKLELLETINKVKNNYLFEKQEEALMEIIRVYNKN